ncbi:hypothetical protein AB0I53_35080 [Saccharopolyspora sp. NPDC050389]|uniref:hypothetical protein n=1 Tax=Saccharopolyspora sp. NPDC050389 TaxID=3155516 RepID=UPI0033E04EEF
MIVAILAAIGLYIGILDGGLSLWDRFFGSPTSPPPPPEPAETNRAESAAPTTEPRQHLAYGPPKILNWGLRFPGDGCGNGVLADGQTINWDDVVGDPDPGADDIGYQQQTTCSDYTRIFALDGSKGGLVTADQAHDPLTCRSAALAGALPNYIEPRTRKEARLVEGAALCVLTDRGRVVRARIDRVVDDTENFVKDVVLELSGEAIIWEPK